MYLTHGLRREQSAVDNQQLFVALTRHTRQISDTRDTMITVLQPDGREHHDTVYVAYTERTHNTSASYSFGSSMPLQNSGRSHME